MLLLHLSDIHFRAGETATSQDPNSGLRAALVDDVERSFERLGAMPRCILVSGDVAFGGATEEYDYASRWLDGLCNRLSLPPDSVFVVPGNHDVDRAITESTITKSVHRMLKEDATSPSSEAFRDMLTDEATRMVLYRALENYNAFAARYSCALEPPDETLAEERLDLGNGWTLRLVGLNSAVLSSGADRPGTLHVDNASFSLRPEPGCLTVVICHHPYNWLAFGDQLRDILDGVAPLQLFGHEHTVRPEMTRDAVRMRSGAVHPERDWGDWNPGYNIIDVDIAERNDGWYAAITVHVRTWQKAPPQFIPLFDRDRQVFEAQIKLGVSPPPAKTPRSPGGK